MTTVVLSDLLTEDQIKGVHRILNMKADDLVKTNKLKEHLMQFEEQLTDKGCLPEYLTYVIMANYHNLCVEAAARN